MFKFKKIIFFLGLVLCVNFMRAQQDPMYSMYMFDKALINPAFAGSSNWVVATLKHRNQFANLSGNPITQTFNIHTPIQKKHIGLGMKITNDKIGFTKSLNVAGMFSYHLNFLGGKLSFGLEAGVVNKSIDFQKLIVDSRQDNTLPMNQSSTLLPDLSGGFYFQKKQFYLGLSAYHLIKKVYDFETPLASDAHLYKHFYMLVGNVFELNKKFNFEPSLLIKMQSTSTIQVDLNAIVYYNSRIGVGAQYRLGEAVVGILRVNITDAIRIAYSYDYTLSKISPYAKSAHELIISFGIKLPPPPIQKEIHPRYYF